MTTRLGTSEPGTRAPATDRRRARTIQRHPVDLVRVFLGLAITGVGVLIAQRGQVSVFERDVFRIVNDLPPIIYPIVWLVMQLGNIVGVAVVSGVSLAAGRIRMARDIAVSGGLAYLAASFVKSVVGRQRPGGLPVGTVLHEGPVGGLGFVSGHSAVAAAMAAAAVPYLSRRGRRVAWALAWAVALSRVYVGAHLPLDVVGGIATGWAIGALVHWAFGVPRWLPTVTRADQVLRRFGLVVPDLRPAGVQARSSHPFEGTDQQGRRVYVKLLDPDRAERDWLYRLYRLLAFRDVKDADAVASLDRQAEQEAFAALTAREHGVRAPSVLLARGDDRGAVVVQEYVVGRSLDALPPQELTPELLRQVWLQVARLREAGIAHHDLVASSVLVDERGRPWIVDFGNAKTAAEQQALDGDVAELMASLALLVDPGTVVRTAVEVIGRDAVSDALPGLAPLTLTAATRVALTRHHSRLAELRQQIRAQLGLPDAARPAFRPAGMAARIAAAAGVVAVLVGMPLLSGASDVLGAVEVGGWRWLGAAVAFAVLARGAMAAAALCTVERRLAVGRTYAATMVADGATLLHGRRGWRRAAARFLEQAGVQSEDAQRSIDRFTAGTIIAAAVTAIATLALTLVEGRLTGWQTPAALVPAMLLGAGACALVLLGQWLAGRHDAALPARSAPDAGVTGALRAALRRPTGTAGTAEPWHRGHQLGWSVTAVVLEAATLAAALHAVGGDVPLLTTLSVYAALNLLWSVIPVIGAPGAADLVLLLVLTALGAPLAAACAAMLTFRLWTFWLPAAAGTLLVGRFERRLLL